MEESDSNNRRVDKEQNHGNDERSCEERPFGVDSQRGIMHKATNADIRTELINIKFYFDAASDSIQRIIKTMNRLDKYEKEK